MIPNEWVETNSSVSKTAKIFSSAPGRRFPGSTGSMDPEDYAEIGGLWEALERNKISFTILAKPMRLHMFVNNGWILLPGQRMV